MVRVMQEKGKIPLFIVEEHHEAFFIWAYACFKGFINPYGNTLLHVDSHEDMVSELLEKSIDELSDDPKEIYEYVYKEFGIASFIVPAIYRGLINQLIYLHRYDAFCGEEINKYVVSYQSEGKFFKIGDVNPLIRMQLEGAEQKWGNHQFYRYQEMGVASQFKTSQALILDIDLDYFSCDNSLSSAKTKIEITKEAYLDFQNNKYHPFRIMPAAALTVSQEENRYYISYHEWQEIPGLPKISFDRIDKRIAKFMDFLKRNHIKPDLIDICRSRLSGYTPEEHWEYIEKKLLTGLGELYDIEISSISEFEQIYGGNNDKNGARSD